jgi:hypothetical protein
MDGYMSKVSHNGSRKVVLARGNFWSYFKNTHFKSVNITDGRFVPYITGCVVNFNINMK